jgi:AAA+ superfamily predicted ATPase
MSNFFKVKSVTDIKNVKEGDKITESDFSLFTSDDRFVQWEFVEAPTHIVETYSVSAGIFTIAIENQKMVLQQSGFTSANILEEYISTKDISNKINTFFNKLDVYKLYNMDPKRAILLYGAPGCGKSQTISKVCNEYAQKEDTCIVIWPSDKYEARHVKDFIKRFEYATNKVTKLFLIIEDLGGVENADGGRRYSESSLLSLLDNVEKTFTIPTMILATTNYPENFLENLTNRPQRFDDVMEVKRPSAEFRAKFLEFFSQGKATESSKLAIQDNKYNNFSVAHVKEVVIRSALYDITLEEAMLQLFAQSSRATKGFSNQKSMGIGSSFND